MSIDLGPAAERMTKIIGNISDEQLAGPTPCPDYTVGDLVEHVGGLSFAFTVAATKDFGQFGDGDQGPSGDASRLGDNWRTEIPQHLAGLAGAWRDPEAWTGMTKAGGIDLPGEVAGIVALDELVVHGWDLAVATGQDFDIDDDSLESVHEFVAQFAGSGGADGLFGPAVPVPESAPRLDQVIGLTGRDPEWSLR